MYQHSNVYIHHEHFLCVYSLWSCRNTWIHVGMILIISAIRICELKYIGSFITVLFIKPMIDVMLKFYITKSYIMCCGFFLLFVFVLCLVYPMLSVSLDCPFLIALSMFSILVFYFIKYLFISSIHYINLQSLSVTLTRHLNSLLGPGWLNELGSCIT